MFIKRYDDHLHIMEQTGQRSDGKDAYAYQIVLASSANRIRPNRLMRATDIVSNHLEGLLEGSKEIKLLLGETGEQLEECHASRQEVDAIHENMRKMIRGELVAVKFKEAYHAISHEIREGGCSVRERIKLPLIL